MSDTLFKTETARADRKNTLLFLLGVYSFFCFCCFTVLAKILGGKKLIRRVYQNPTKGGVGFPAIFHKISSPFCRMSLKCHNFFSKTTEKFDKTSCTVDCSSTFSQERKGSTQNKKRNIVFEVGIFLYLDELLL